MFVPLPTDVSQKVATAAAAGPTQESERVCHRPVWRRRKRPPHLRRLGMLEPELRGNGDSPSTFIGDSRLESPPEVNEPLEVETDGRDREGDRVSDGSQRRRKRRTSPDHSVGWRARGTYRCGRATCSHGDNCLRYFFSIYYWFDDYLVR